HGSLPGGPGRYSRVSVRFERLGVSDGLLRQLRGSGALHGALSRGPPDPRSCVALVATPGRLEPAGRTTADGPGAGRSVPLRCGGTSHPRPTTFRVGSTPAGYSRSRIVASVPDRAKRGPVGDFGL